MEWMRPGGMTCYQRGMKGRVRSVCVVRESGRGAQDDYRVVDDALQSMNDPECAASNLRQEGL